MDKRGLKSIIIILSIILYTILYKLYIFKNILSFSQTLSACFFVTMLFISIGLYGFERSKLNPTKKNIVFGILVCFGFYFVIIYGLGLILGFLKNSYSLELKTIISNTFFIISIAISMELLRYNFIRSNKDRMVYIVIFTIALSIFEIIFNISSNSFQSKYEIFAFVTKIVIPLSIKNYVLSYIVYQVGYIPTLVYNVVFSSYFYIVPIIPNLGDFLESVSLIVLPLFIYIYSSRIVYLHDNKEELEFETPGFKLVDIPGILLIAVFAYLISGIGTVHLIGIGSNSMMPKINKGDAVLIIKNVDIDKLKKYDIISYKTSTKRVVHRINDIKIVNGEKIFETKGDANNAPDSVVVTKQKIEGKVMFKIPFIAYPTVWINEIFSKE